MTNAVVDFYLVSSAVIRSVILDNSALPGYTGIKS